MRSSHHLGLQLEQWRSSNNISDSYAKHGKNGGKKYENEYGKRNAFDAYFDERQFDCWSIQCTKR